MIALAQVRVKEKTLLYSSLALTALAAAFAVYKVRSAFDTGPTPTRMDITPVSLIESAKPLAPAEVPVTLTSSDGTGLKLVALRAEAAIEDPLALTELHLTFENPQDRVLEGQFRITLPQGASMSRFAMKVNGAWQEGEVVEKQAARQAYEDFLHRRQDPALMERGAGNEFSARVFPIAAHQLKEIVITYAEAVEVGAPYVLPLRGLPELGTLDVNVHVAGSKAAVMGGKTDGLYGIHQSRFTPNADFVLDATRVPRSSGLRNGNLAITRVIPFGASRPEPVTSALVLVDTSASRALGLTDEANVLRDVIARLPGDSTVTVACFDQNVAPIYSGKASGFGDREVLAITARGALGASDFQNAITWARAEAKKQKASRIVFVTDGVATAGEVDAQKLRLDVEKLRESGVTRMDAIAMGGIRDDAFLRTVVHGVLDHDGVVLDAALGAEAVAHRLGEATTAGLTVKVEGAKWSYPSTLQGLQSGDEILVYSEYEPTDKGRPVTIDVGGQVFKPDLRTIDRPLVERAWAQAKIQSLIEDPKENAASTKQEIIALSTRHRVLSPHTALLVLENDSDYRRFNIDRTATVDILAVREGHVAVMQRGSADEKRDDRDEKSKDDNRPVISQRPAEQPASAPPQTMPIAPQALPVAPPTYTPPVVAPVPVPGMLGATPQPTSATPAPTPEPAAPPATFAAQPPQLQPQTIAPVAPLAPPPPDPAAVAASPAPPTMDKPSSAPAVKRKSRPAARPSRPSLDSDDEYDVAPAKKPARAPKADEEQRKALEMLKEAMEETNPYDPSPGSAPRPAASAARPPLHPSPRPSGLPRSRSDSEPTVTTITPPPPVATVRATTIANVKGLDASDLQSAMRGAAPRFRECYAAELARNELIRGTLTIYFAVDKAGVAQTVELEMIPGSDAFRRCVTAVAKTIRIAGPGGAFTASFDLVGGGGASTGMAQAMPYEGRFKSVMEALAQGSRDVALQEATTWHSEQPGDILSLVALGEVFEARKELEQAARAYGSILELFSFRADSRRFAGERLERLHQTRALALAADSYAKAVEQRPDHPASHRLHAYALVKQGEHEKAFEAIAKGITQRYPEGRFRGVDRILREDAGLIAAAWTRAQPKRAAEIRSRLQAAGGTEENGPSLRFVLLWETDANDVDFHIADGRGGHAYYSQPNLASGGQLYADVTTGYGPECFTIRGARAGLAFPYTLQAHYFSRGPMGYGMGKVEILEHDGKGALTFAERPFVVMADSAYVDLGTVDRSTKLTAL